MKTMKTKNFNLKEQGITLVALVVTIIILLILAGVTINIALRENGLFKMARTGANKYEQSATNEQQTLGDIEQEIKNIVEGYVPDRSMLKVGDEVNYTPKTEKMTYTLEGNKSGYGDYPKNSWPSPMTSAKDQEISQEKYTWKIMDINSKTGEVKIMGVPPDSRKYVSFGGALGYNNGVYLLDEICKELYSNSELGVTARSIDIEDIESKMSDKGRDVKNDYISNHQAIKEFTTEKYTYYPEIYQYQQDSNIDGTENREGISESDDGTKTEAGIPISHETDGEGYTQAETSITVKGTYYDITPKEEYYNDQDFYNLIFKTGIDYWIASRYSNCSSGSISANFGLRQLDSIFIRGSVLFYGSGYYSCNGRKVCPVVSLGPDIQITREGNEGAWNLSKQ